MSKIINFGCGPKNSIAKQPVRIVSTLQKRDISPEILNHNLYKNEYK